MPRLSGTEEWNENLILGKARYYLETMASVAELADAFDSSARRQDDAKATAAKLQEETIDVRLEQFSEAMGLLLATDHSEQVRSFFSDPGWILNGFPTDSTIDGFGRVRVNVRHFVGISLFAALAREGGMTMGEEGLEYATSFGSIVLEKDQEDDREFLAVLPTLFSIALASKLEVAALYELFSNMAVLRERYGSLGVYERPETTLLGLYLPFFENNSFGVRTQIHLDWTDGFLAMRELERRYTTRVQEMRTDLYHWERMNIPGDMIDWVLLITQVALLRIGQSPFLPENFPRPSETRFCWDLAQALA